MAKNQQWSYVFEKDREKLVKYFRREVCGDVYIRLYIKYVGTGFTQYFQMSGNNVGFNSIVVKTDSMEKAIYKDFPFIKEISVYKI